MSNHLIQTIDCLTEEEVSTVLNILEDRPWEPATVFGMEGCEVNKDIRSNERYCASDSDPEVSIMHRAMNEALIKYKDEVAQIHSQFHTYPVPGTYRTNCYREPIQVLRYGKGEHYSWHSDQATDKRVNENNRTISVVLYLKNADVGGRTVFHHRAFKPKAGQALIFPSNWCFPHSSEPVQHGQKIVAVTWYHSHYNYD